MIIKCSCCGKNVAYLCLVNGSTTCWDCASELKDGASCTHTEKSK